MKKMDKRISITIKCFIRFLKENDSYRRYVINVRKLRDYRIISINDLYNYLRIKPCEDYIIMGFSWISSNEGYDYWYDIHMSYLKYVKDTILQIITEEDEE